MANSLCSRTSAPNTPINRSHKGELSAGVNPQQGENPSTPWTPARHALAHKTKPVRLLSLGGGSHGKTALLEFPEGWQRTIDLPTEADAWHPLFDALTHKERLKLRQHVAQPVVVRADGKRVRPLGLSFTTSTVTARGAWVAYNHFDVPAQEYGAGSITGYRCAAELLAALQRGYGPHIDIPSIVREAAASARCSSGAKPSRAGAAVAFMSVVTEALKFLAQNSLHAEYIGREIAKVERLNVVYDELEAERKAAFIERMRAGRAAKRAAQEVSA